MGFETDRFVEAIEEMLLCGICHKVYDHPKQLSSCNHIYCISCIEKQIVSHGVCPQDQIAIESEKIKEAPNFIIEYLGKLKIKCDFAQYGCKEEVPLKSLVLHRLGCENHPGRKIKCNNCGSVYKKVLQQSHNCIHFLQQVIENQCKQIEEIKESHSKELAQLKSQLHHMQFEFAHFRNLVSSHFESSSNRSLMPPAKQMIAFSCLNEGIMGSTITIFIQTRYVTFKCEANLITKFGQIKYYASLILHAKTNEMALYFNGIELNEHGCISDYDIHSSSQFQLLPKKIFITFNCVDVRIILGFNVSPNDTINDIIVQLLDEIRKIVPKSLYEFLQQCTCSLYFNKIRLEETYQLSNYDVLSMETLNYCNQLSI